MTGCGPEAAVRLIFEWTARIPRLRSPVSRCHRQALVQRRERLHPPGNRWGIRVIPGLACLAYSRRSANQVRDRGFRRGRPGAVLWRTIEFCNDGEGLLTVSSDERLGGTGQKTLSSPWKSR